jgi:hypothetical protein
VTDGTAGRCGTALIVRATGPGGTTEKEVGVYHAEPQP